MSKQPFKQSMRNVPWGAFSGITITFLALFGAELIGFGLVSGFLAVTSGTDVEAAASLIQQQIPLAFISYALVRMIGLGMVYGFVRYRGGGWHELGFRPFQIKQAVWIIFVSFIGFFAVAVLASTLLNQLLPNVDLGGQQQISFLSARVGIERVLAFVALVIIAPFAEEAIFRGFLLPALGKSFGLIVAVVLTSIAFGLLHPPLNAMITIGIFALFLCFTYIRTGSIYPAILLHSSKNLIAFLAAFKII